jgi:hypothetical protein
MLAKARDRVVREIENPKYVFVVVTKVVFPKKHENGSYYYGFARGVYNRTVYFFQKPPKATQQTIFAGPLAFNGPVGHGSAPKKGHVLYGAWETHKSKKGPRLLWWVFGLELLRFKTCLKEKNTIFVRKPAGVLANRVIELLLWGKKKLTNEELMCLAFFCADAKIYDAYAEAEAEAEAEMEEFQMKQFETFNLRPAGSVDE